MAKKDKTPKVDEVELEEPAGLGEPGGPEVVEHPKPIEGDSSEPIKKK